MPSPVQIGKRFYLRVRVPKDLASQLLGRIIFLPVAGVYRGVKVGSSIKLSLDSNDSSVAKARFSEAFAALQGVLLAANSGPTALSHKQLLALAGEIRSIFVEAFDDEPATARMWFNVISRNNKALDGRLHPLMIPSADTKSADMEERFGPFVDIKLAQKGLVMGDDQRLKLLHLVAHALNEAVIVNLAKADGDYSDDGKSHRYPSFESPPAQGRSVKASTSQNGGLPDLTFGKLIEEEIRRRSAGKDAVPMRDATIRKFRATAELFCAFRGNDDAANVTAREVESWKQSMLEEGDVGSNTIGQRIQNLRTIVQWAKEQSLGELYTNGNPLDIVKRPTFRTVSSADRAYTMEEARVTLLAARKEVEPELRWLPWMCAYSGARINEVAQLTKEDFFQVGTDWFFRLTTAGGKSLKNRHSERVVPVHPALVDEGLIAFINSLKGKDTARIFPERSQPNISEWLRGKVGITREELAPNHGWRHLFEDLCILAGMPDAARTYITGRTTGKSNESYGKTHVMLPGLAAAMRAIPPFSLKKPTTN